MFKVKQSHVTNVLGLELTTFVSEIMLDTVSSFILQLRNTLVSVTIYTYLCGIPWVNWRWLKEQPKYGHYVVIVVAH